MCTLVFLQCKWDVLGQLPSQENSLAMMAMYPLQSRVFPLSIVKVEMPHTLQAEDEHVNILGKQIDIVSVISFNRCPKNQQM